MLVLNFIWTYIYVSKMDKTYKTIKSFIIECKINNSYIS